MRLVCMTKGWFVWISGQQHKSSAGNCTLTFSHDSVNLRLPALVKKEVISKPWHHNRSFSTTCCISLVGTLWRMQFLHVFCGCRFRGDSKKQHCFSAGENREDPEADCAKKSRVYSGSTKMVSSRWEHQSKPVLKQQQQKLPLIAKVLI